MKPCLMESGELQPGQRQVPVRDAREAAEAVGARCPRMSFSSDSSALESIHPHCHLLQIFDHSSAVASKETPTLRN